MGSCAGADTEPARRQLRAGARGDAARRDRDRRRDDRLCDLPAASPRRDRFRRPDGRLRGIAGSRNRALGTAPAGAVVGDRRDGRARLPRRHRRDGLGAGSLGRLRHLLRLARNLRLLLRPRWALVQTAWIAALYAVAVVLDDQQGPVELWVNGVATTLGVGLLVLALRTRIESLLGTLERTAHRPAHRAAEPPCLRRASRRRACAARPHPATGSRC